MFFTEFEEQKKIPDSLLPDPSLDVEAGENDVCLVDNLFAFPLEAASRIYPREETIAVIDSDGISLGELVTCAGEEFKPLPSFSAPYLAAYLSDIPASRFGQSGKFSHDFLLVHSDRLHEYRSQYLEGSSIWGGFQHLSVPPASYIVTSGEPIRAVSGLKLPTDLHVEIASRSVSQPFAFERYLKLYHLLELSFDREVVIEIQNLGSDLRGIGKILSNLESSELNRLKQMFLRCRNVDPIIDCIKTLTSDARWRDYIMTIFFDFGKDGNPLSGKKNEFMAVILNDEYSLRTIQPIGGIQGGRATPEQQKAYETFSLRLAAYWTYRVRSSIAHSRIGEYVMRSEDEPFVTFFAERLLRTVLQQVL